MKRILLAAALATATLAQAQNYPSKPVRMIIGYAAGSGADIGGRAVADAMSQAMKTPWVVENRPGGNVQIALNALRQADADGYTVIWGGAAPLAVQPMMDPKLSGLEKAWDPTADFAVAGFIGRYDGMFYTGAVGPKNIRELIEQLRSPSANVNWGSFSAGSTFDLAQEYLVYLAKGKATPVRYKGGADITTDLMAGRLTFSMTTLTPNNFELIKAGKIRGLAVLSKDRLPLAPDLPSLSEIGLPEMAEVEWDAWFGVFARKATPAPVMEKLNEATRAVLGDKANAEKFSKMGINPYPPATLRESQQRWERSFASTKVMLGKLNYLAK